MERTVSFPLCGKLKAGTQQEQGENNLMPNTILYVKVTEQYDQMAKDPTSYELPEWKVLNKSV